MTDAPLPLSGIRVLDLTRALAGPIYDMPEVFRDAQVRHAGMVETVEHPEIGPLKLLSNPLRLDGVGPRTVRLPPPVLGQHSAEVLAEYGIHAGRVAELREGGVVAVREVPQHAGA